jgi:hypothetical protein
LEIYFEIYVFSAYIDFIKVPHGDEAEEGYIDWYGTVAGWGFTRDGQCIKINFKKIH